MARLPATGDVLLFEVKTLEDDELTQARRAVGQLSYYDHFVVRREFDNAAAIRVACFERLVSEVACTYLIDEGISVMAERADRSWSVTPAGPAARLLTQFDFSQSQQKSG